MEKSGNSSKVGRSQGEAAGVGKQQLGKLEVGLPCDWLGMHLYFLLVDLKLEEIEKL